MENTKEYVCRAIVTIVDHLGSVSANLEYEFSKTNTVSDVELRINCLKQVRLFSLSHDLINNFASWYNSYDISISINPFTFFVH